MTNASLEAYIGRYEQALATVHEVSRAVLMPQDAPTLYRTIYSILRSIIPYDAGYIEFYDEAQDQMITVYSLDGDIEEFSDEAWDYRSSPPVVWMVTKRQPVCFKDFQPELKERFNYERVQTFGDTSRMSRAWLSVPLTIGERLVGIINVQSYEHGIYGPFEEELMQLLGVPIAVAIANTMRITTQERAIDALRVPLLPITADIMVIPLVEGLDAERLELAIEAILSTVVAQGTEHVLIDVSGIRTYDPHLIRMLTMTMQALNLSGAEGTLIGLHPLLIEGLMTMGVDFKEIRIARDLPSVLRTLSIKL